MTINWNSSILWGVIGLFGGFAISTFYYYLGKKTRIIVDYIYCQELFSKNMSFFKGLSLKFNGAPVPDLVSSTVEIKNVGTETVESTDFAKLSPLCIKTSGKFLVFNSVNSFLKYVSNPACGVQLILLDEQTIKIVFDFLKKGDKIELSVLHTGSIDVTGNMKAGQLIGIDVPVDKFRGSQIAVVSFVIWLVSWIVLLLITEIVPEPYKTIIDNFCTGWLLLVCIIGFYVMRLPLSNKTDFRER